MTYFMILFFLQGALMMIDEFHFHRERGLGRWERIGHPVDTFVFATALGVIALFPETRASFRSFVGISIFSSLLISKDAWVHHRECSAAEEWLHSLLFILHPLVLISAGWLWPKASSGLPRHLFLLFFVSTILFLIYQTLYWNIYEPQSRFIGKTASVRNLQSVHQQATHQQSTL